MHIVVYLSSSREDTILHKWMSNLVRIFRCTWPLSCWSLTVIPSSMSVSSSLSLSWEDPYYQPAPPLFEEGSCLRPVLPFRGESISSTFSSFSKKVHIFIICSPITVPPCEDNIFKLHQSCHRNIQNLLKIEAWSIHQQLAHRYSHTIFL